MLRTPIGRAACARLLSAGIAALLLGACGSSASPTESSTSGSVATLSASEEHLTYVALGDSLLFALSEDCNGCTSATELYGQQIEDALGVPVETHNLTAHNGLDSAGLLGYLEDGAHLGRLQEDALAAVASADIISVTIGFNDVGFADGPKADQLVKAYGENLEKILTRIDTLRAGKPTMLRVTTIYNNGVGAKPDLDPDGPGTGIGFWKPIVEAQNTLTCEVVAAHHADCVDIYVPFNGADGTESPAVKGYLGPDGTHPSQLGMDVIADALAAAGYAPLQ